MATTTLPNKETSLSPPRGFVPILVKITEDDRQKAGSFSHPQRCLISTALRRMGYGDASVGGDRAWIAGRFYIIQGGSRPPDLYWDWIRDEKGTSPFYGEGVVGHQIILHPLWNPPEHKSLYNVAMQSIPLQ